MGVGIIIDPHDIPSPVESIIITRTMSISSKIIILHYPPIGLLEFD